ncbi:MAG: hypothetical protein AAGA88_09785, partial [Pseudomonadota bacterium]
MARKREKPEDIVSKLRQVEVLQGQGATIAEAVRQIGVTQQTFYRLLSAIVPIACRAKGGNSMVGCSDLSSPA